MIDRFDFEQQLMSCWNVVEDIKVLNKQFTEHVMTEDEVSNFLLGLETIYQVKFNQLMDAFEELIAKKKL